MISHCAGGGAAAMVASALHFFAAIQGLIDEPWPRTAAVTNGSHFDFIIVGSGTAGSTLAARLAAVYQISVLLVEAGGYPPEEAIIPGYRDLLKSSKYDWNFTTVNDGFSSQGLRGGRQVQHGGKVLGGSDTIGDMVYSRGRPDDYNEWAALVGDTWNWTNVLNYFKKTEAMTDPRIVNNEELMQFHGTTGEIHVSGRNEFDLATTKLLESFKELGFDIVDDMTYPCAIGAGRFSHTIKHGRRQSTVTALLNNVQADNLKVLKNTYVTKILIENGMATGIKAISNGKEIVLYSDKEVILSAGTFNTPKLLMLSGIGPKEHLTELGINVLQDSAVGENLHDHVMVTNYLLIENGTCTVDRVTQYFEMIKYLYDASGRFSYSDSMGAYMAKSGGDPHIPHYAIYPTCMPKHSLSLDSCLNILGYDHTVCSKLVKANQNHELIPLPVVLLKPQSRGRIKLNSTDPLEDPLIFSGTFSNLVDYEGYSEAINKALALVNTTYFQSQRARILDFMEEKCSEFDDMEERMRCKVKNYAMSAWHSVGTAAMGTVVDSELRVKGVNSLRVVDASVMPIIIRGNINAAVVMIAEKVADFIKTSHDLHDKHNTSTSTTTTTSTSSTPSSSSTIPTTIA